MLLTRIPFGVRLQNEATNGNKMEANTGLFLQRKEEKLENQAIIVFAFPVSQRLTHLSGYLTLKTELSK